MDAPRWVPIATAVAFWASVATFGRPRDRDRSLVSVAETAVVEATRCALRSDLDDGLPHRGHGVCDRLAGRRWDAEERLLFQVACVVNGVGNVWWSWLFFSGRAAPDWALWQVGPFWGSIFWMYWTSRPLAYEAGIWFAPYLTWVTIAIYLNWTIVKLNGPFRGR